MQDDRFNDAEEAYRSIVIGRNEGKLFQRSLNEATLVAEQQSDRGGIRFQAMKTDSGNLSANKICDCKKCASLERLSSAV